MVSGRSSAHTSHPATPRNRRGTSPTATDTTGRLQASASFTALGEPSCTDVKTSASHPFM